jgi:hypothetical protein
LPLDILFSYTIAYLLKGSCSHRWSAISPGGVGLADSGSELKYEKDLYIGAPATIGGNLCQNSRNSWLVQWGRSTLQANFHRARTYRFPFSVDLALVCKTLCGIPTKPSFFSKNRRCEIRMDASLGTSAPKMARNGVPERQNLATDNSPHASNVNTPVNH